MMKSKLYRLVSSI